MKKKSNSLHDRVKKICRYNLFLFMRFILILVLFTFLQGSAAAVNSKLLTDADANMQQERNISGLVTSQNGEPIPGVTVLVKGTTIGTVTDFDGKYTIKSSSVVGTLVFSYIGMRTQEIEPGTIKTIDVVMEDDMVGVDEIVVVGYGIQKKSDLTGSIVSIKSDELLKLPVSRVDQAIQGKISGVSISNDKATPGAGPVIRIRGGELHEWGQFSFGGN